MFFWRRGLLAVLGLVWAAGLAWAWWWFDGYHNRTFEQPAHFAAAQVSPPFAPGRIQVMHVWQAGCPCNAGHEAYIADMTGRFSAQGVRFVRSGSSVAAAGSVLADLPYWPMPEGWSDWPGGPALAIWDAQGQLAYVGPYSDGASCNSDSSFVEPVLRALLQGRSVNITQQDTVACLCPLQE